MTLAFISHADVGFHDNGWNHPEHVGRIRAITRALRYAPDLFMGLDHVEGRHATDAELAMGHDPAYVARVKALSEAGGGRFDEQRDEGSGGVFGELLERRSHRLVGDGRGCFAHDVGEGLARQQ